jgi:predicted ArsR family transcriptional regulator
MVRERDDETGRITETITPDRVLRAVRNGGYVVSASEVAESLDCSTDGARRKLNQLHEDGKVNSRKVGRSVVYWIDEDSDS